MSGTKKKKKGEKERTTSINRHIIIFTHVFSCALHTYTLTTPSKNQKKKFIVQGGVKEGC